MKYRNYRFLGYMTDVHVLYVSETPDLNSMNFFLVSFLLLMQTEQH